MRVLSCWLYYRLCVLSLFLILCVAKPCILIRCVLIKNVYGCKCMFAGVGILIVKGFCVFVKVDIKMKQI